MRGRTTSLVAATTCLAFTTYVLWPRSAAAAPTSDKGAAAPSGQSAAPAPPSGAAQAAAPPQAAPGGEDATLQEAKQHFETGRNAYNAGDYVTAIHEFKQAEALRPSPILAYNIALANEKLGKRRVAVKYYRRYLEQQPNAANRAEVEQKIATLEQEIAQQPAAAAVQPGGTAPQPGAPGAETPPPPPPTAEQPSDMPPPDPNAGRVQPGYYDPYASQPPPGAPAAQKPKKKKSYWWIGLIVAGAVSITIAIIVVAVLFADATTTTTYYGYDHSALTPGPAPRVDRHDLGGVTLFRF